MRVLKSPRAFQRWCRAQKNLALVPTMGALHQGHLSLVRAARRRCSHVAVSIFVNPTQFGAGEDFDAYPRTLAADLRMLKGEGVDAVFAPTASAMYPRGFCCKVEVGGPLAGILEGARRPGHFAGVATVVAKLFALSRARLAFFGRKDYQQLLVVRRMAQDLNLGVRVVACPTLRSSDGLALSSRNAYLNGAQREAAPALRAALAEAARCLKAGGTFARARQAGRARLALEKQFRLDYLEIADAATLGAPVSSKPAVVLAAAFLGKTRLIDNLPCGARRPRKRKQTK